MKFLSVLKFLGSRLSLDGGRCGECLLVMRWLSALGVLEDERIGGDFKIILLFALYFSDSEMLEACKGDSETSGLFA